MGALALFFRLLTEHHPDSSSFRIPPSSYIIPNSEPITQNSEPPESSPFNYFRPLRSTIQPIIPNLWLLNQNFSFLSPNSPPPATSTYDKGISQEPPTYPAQLEQAPHSGYKHSCLVCIACSLEMKSFMTTNKGGESCVEHGFLF